jgi:hypothetical protein
MFKRLATPRIGHHKRTLPPDAPKTHLIRPAARARALSLPALRSNLPLSPTVPEALFAIPPAERMRLIDAWHGVAQQK